MKPASLWPQGGGKATYPPSMPHRVLIERPSETRSASGARTTGWATVRDSVPARVMPLSGSEYMAASSTSAKVNTRIIVPFLEGLDATMRITHLGTLYNIRVVLPDLTLRMYLTLLCESGVDHG